MKKGLKSASFLFLFFLLASKLDAQQAVYMRMQEANKLLEPTKDHQGEFKLNSFEVEIENMTTIGSMSGGAGAGKAKLNPLTVKRPYHPENNSDLSMRLATGAHFPVVEILIYNPMGKWTTKISFGMVFVSKISTSFDGDQLTETIEFAYGKIQWTPTKSTGEMLPKKGWDMMKNMKAEEF